MDRILGLFDLHVPYNVDLDPVMEFARDFKPTKVVLGGDLHDWTAVCHWIADQSRHLQGESIKQNYAELERVLLKPLQKAVGGTRKILIPGNHERWLEQAIQLEPNGAEYWRLEDNVKLREYNIQLLKFNQAWQANKNLVYIHGLYTNDSHAKKTVNAYHTSVIYGHCHTVQSYTMVSPVDSDKFYKGQAVGCLCKLNPHYAENRPNAWVNGFSYAYVDEDGTFEDYPVVMVKGKFWALGRRYK